VSFLGNIWQGLCYLRQLYPRTAIREVQPARCHEGELATSLAHGTRHKPGLYYVRHFILTEGVADLHGYC
jgi:hypothetical protein